MLRKASPRAKTRISYARAADTGLRLRDVLGDHACRVEAVKPGGARRVGNHVRDLYVAPAAMSRLGRCALRRPAEIDGFGRGQREGTRRRARWRADSRQSVILSPPFSSRLAVQCPTLRSDLGVARCVGASACQQPCADLSRPTAARAEVVSGSPLPARAAAQIEQGRTSRLAGPSETTSARESRHTTE